MVGTPLWASDGWAPLPPLTGRARVDVCVVGLGGSGLSAVLELLRLGRSVVGLEAAEVASGAAGRNGGFLLAGLAAFHHDARVALGRERARDLYQLTREGLEHEVEVAGNVVRRTGSLRIAADDAELRDCEAHLGALLEDGFSGEWYEGPEGEGLLLPEDATFDPLERCRLLAREALARGATLHEGSRALDIRGDRVTTQHGEVECGVVIVAVDGGLSAVLPELAGEVRDVRLQMLGTAPTSEVVLPRPVYRRSGFEYYQQDRHGRFALGGFRDQAGASEWTSSAAPTPEVQALLEGYLRDGIGVRAPITHRWAATVGYTSGVLPLARRLRGNVWAIGGYNGTGNVVGAVLGRAAARKAVGADPDAWSAFGGT